MHSGDICVCNDALSLIGYFIQYLVLVIAGPCFSLDQTTTSSSAATAVLDFKLVEVINTSCTTSVPRCNKREASRAYKATSYHVIMLGQTSLQGMQLYLHCLKAPHHHRASLSRSLTQMSLLLPCLANSAFKLSHCCRCDVQKPCNRGNDCRSSSAQPCQSRHTRSH